jgi:hypothetical protein
MNTRTQKLYAEKESAMVGTPVSVQPSRSSTLNQQSEVPFPTLNHALLIMISFMLASAIGLAIRGLVLAHRRKSQQKLSSVQLIHPTPCQRCQYFGPNPYLKCAIHPVTVMTEASADCSDYWPNRNE